MEQVTVGRNWWALLLRGLVAIGFSVVAWSRPGPTLTILVFLFGAYAIGDGVAAFIGAGRAARREEGWFLLVLEGVLGVALGIFTLSMPVKAMTIAFLLIAMWALCTGVLEIVEAVRLRRLIPGEWLLMLSGFVRIAFGAILLTRPGAAALTLLWITAGYALVDGILLVALSLRLRRHGAARRRVGTGGMTPQPA
jgi:uncharacterized membrane protein HdeD (DUF308 family)